MHKSGLSSGILFFRAIYLQTIPWYKNSRKIEVEAQMGFDQKTLDLIHTNTRWAECVESWKNRRHCKVSRNLPITISTSQYYDGTLQVRSAKNSTILDEHFITVSYLSWWGKESKIFFHTSDWVALLRLLGHSTHPLSSFSFTTGSFESYWGYSVLVCEPKEVVLLESAYVDSHANRKTKCTSLVVPLSMWIAFKKAVRTTLC